VGGWEGGRELQEGGWCSLYDVATDTIICGYMITQFQDSFPMYYGE